jgi:hypothetical protein
MLDYAALETAHGPLRPVLAADATDVAELERLLAVGGRKAVTSLAAALETVFHEVREDHDEDQRQRRPAAMTSPSSARRPRRSQSARPGPGVAMVRLSGDTVTTDALAAILRAHPAIEVAHRRIQPERAVRGATYATGPCSGPLT